MEGKCIILLVSVFALTMFLAVPAYAKAQPYLEENLTWEQNLTAVAGSSATFGDINNDGNLDLVAIGCDSGEVGQGCTSYASKIYINNGTTFLENSTWQSNLTGIREGSNNHFYIYCLQLGFHICKSSHYILRISFQICYRAYHFLSSLYLNRQNRRLGR